MRELSAIIVFINSLILKLLGWLIISIELKTDVQGRTGSYLTRVEMECITYFPHIIINISFVWINVTELSCTMAYCLPLLGATYITLRYVPSCVCVRLPRASAPARV